MLKVLSVPHVTQLGKGESGIHSVVRAYFRHGREYGIEFVPPETSTFDVLAIHAGMSGSYPKSGPVVAHCHGLYWTADYNMGRWAYGANKNVVDSVRHAREVTVPSRWVAETFERDMRFTPHIVPHGIDWERWQHDYDPAGYVIGYAKNRADVDVCNPSFLPGLATRFPNVLFKATFSTEDSPNNIDVLGVLPHDEMRLLVQQANVFINTTKETWGIAILEAMAAGIPVLAFAHGGALDLVEHGVTGYLAVPDDYEDLANGLEYCIANWEMLGQNGRAIAYNKFSWHNAMTRLVDVYQKAARPSPPDVGVVIPVYNKPAHELERALDSAKAQTFNPYKIIVVDDGSDNQVDYQTLVESRGAIYHRQRNQGVAVARNEGIKRLPDAKYIVCLDSDDWIEPAFLEACVVPLEQDNSLGIAYTGLQWHKPDESTGLSQWPGEFNYGRHLEGGNQVPTCCVFRREAWSRVGGYHARYAPDGCGEEDANLWLRIPAAGYGAKKVTTAGLFHYSWKSGYVSGSTDHRITDWRYWLPWTRDSQHPFASVAKPHRQSHSVRQYDEPVVSVVIPVGRGHVQLVTNALDSLEAQTFRKWEVIVVLDNWGTPDYDAPASMKYYPDHPLAAYPYAKIIDTYSNKRSMGAGYARNRGAELARGSFLLFLDADDHLHPDAMERMLTEYGMTGDGIYTDYIGKAYVEDTTKLAPELQKNLLDYDEKKKIAVIEYRAADFDQELAMKQPWNPPYIWNNVTTLIPAIWHSEIGGFDESMVSWEDVDYWWRMAWAGKVFTRIAEPLMVYRFNTGGRREQGLKDWDGLLKYLSDKKRELNV